MARNLSRRIVVDANVGRSAGDSDLGEAQRCRDILLVIETVRHRLVHSPEIRAEWQTHASRFTRGWLNAMRRKDLLIDIPSPVTDAFEAAIDGWDRVDRHTAAKKDVPYLLGALATDRLVISRDDRAKEDFRSLAKELPAFKDARKVVWYNPFAAEPDCVAWLRAGARAHKAPRLGDPPPN